MLWDIRRKRRKAAKCRRRFRCCELLERRLYLASDFLGVGPQWDTAWEHEAAFGEYETAFGEHEAAFGEYETALDAASMVDAPLDAIFDDFALDSYGATPGDSILHDSSFQDALDVLVFGEEELGADFADEPLLKWFGEYYDPWDDPLDSQPFGTAIEFGGVEFDFYELPTPGFDPLWGTDWEYEMALDVAWMVYVDGMPYELAVEEAWTAYVGGDLGLYEFAAADYPLEEVIASDPFASVPSYDVHVEWDESLGGGELASVTTQWSAPEWNEFDGGEFVHGSYAPTHGALDSIDAADVKQGGIISVTQLSPIESVAPFTDNDAPAGSPNRMLLVETAIAASDRGYAAVASIDGSVARRPGEVEAKETLAVFDDVAQSVSPLADTTTETDTLRGSRPLPVELSSQPVDAGRAVFVDHVDQPAGRDNLPAAIPVNGQRGHGVGMSQSEVARSVMPAPKHEQVLLTVVFGEPVTRLRDDWQSAFDRGAEPAIEPSDDAASWLVGLWAELPHPRDLSSLSLTVGTVATASLLGLVAYQWRVRGSRDDKAGRLAPLTSSMDETLLAVDLP